MNNFHNFPFFLEILTHFDKLTVNGVKTLKYGVNCLFEYYIVKLPSCSSPFLYKTQPIT